MLLAGSVGMDSFELIDIQAGENISEIDLPDQKNLDDTENRMPTFRILRYLATLILWNAGCTQIPGFHALSQKVKKCTSVERKRLICQKRN